MKYLLDTNVISELVAKQPLAKVINWLDNTDDNLIYLSVITIGEIKKGVERLPDSKRKTMLRTWLSDELLLRFQGRILPVENKGTPAPAYQHVGNVLPAHQRADRDCRREVSPEPALRAGERGNA